MLWINVITIIIFIYISTIIYYSNLLFIEYFSPLESCITVNGSFNDHETHITATIHVKKRQRLNHITHYFSPRDYESL